MNSTEFAKLFTHIDDKQSCALYTDDVHNEVCFTMFYDAHTIQLYSSSVGVQRFVFSVDSVSYDMKYSEYRALLGTILRSTIAYVRYFMSAHKLTYLEFTNLLYEHFNTLFSDAEVYNESTHWLEYIRDDAVAEHDMTLYNKFKAMPIMSVHALSPFVKWDTVVTLFDSITTFLPDLADPENTDIILALHKVLRS